LNYSSPILISALIFGLSSCDPNRVFEKNIDFFDPYWIKDQGVEFKFVIQDTSVEHDLIFNVRSSLSYPFQNIYIQYTLKDSLNQKIISELKEFYLFDQKTGKPLGEGLGDVFDNSFFLNENYSFKNTGVHSLELQQFMRLDSLPMILSVGVRVQKSE